VRFVMRAAKASLKTQTQCMMRKALRSRPEINAGADEYERKQREEIIQALTACKGRIGGTDGAAIRLGINRTTLMYRMTKLGIYAKLYS
jgi:transcriptional regulator with GAF, ATPase, and Fis domain